MPEREYDTTWERFVRECESGYGWARPGTVMQLGRMLRQHKLQDPNLKITVRSGSYDWGGGSSSFTEYYWILIGVEIPNKVISGTAAMFGGSPDFEVSAADGETTITHRSP